MDLTKAEFDIIEKIVGFGGYVTKEIIHIYKKELALDSCYRFLKQLEDKKYIRVRNYFGSFREPLVYQVTRKACTLFGRPEAYMRKPHKPYAIRRYLMRAHYLFYLTSQGSEISLFSSASREEFLKQKGFTTYYLPKKTNKNVEKVQIEEYIINERETSKSICFLYIDNQTFTVRSQLENLFRKYRKMEKKQLSFLTFMVITEDEHKAKLFIDAYDKNFYKPISLIDLKTYSINRNYGAFKN